MANKTSTKRKGGTSALNGSKSKPETKPKMRRPPGRKPFPTLPFEQALRFGQGVADVGSGRPVNRAALFDTLKLPKNRLTRALITASSKYGITYGAHDARQFRLTPLGAKAVRGRTIARTKSRPN